MTEEQTQRERARKVSFNEGSWPRMLEAAHRLHAACDEHAFGAAASAVFSSILGSAPVAIRIVHEVGVSRGFGAEAVADAALALIERATREGLPVLDGQPAAGVALPIQANGRVIGAVYVAHPELRNGLGGGELGLLSLVAAHVGCASVNMRNREAPSDGSAAAAVAPKSMSLHDAKLVFEHRLLQLRLHEARGNVAAAARSLGMDRGQLSRLMRKHSLDRAVFRPI